MNKDIKSALLKNTKLAMTIAYDDGFNHYDSHIEDLCGDFIHIAVPTKRGVRIKLQKGTELNISAQVADNRIIFKSTVKYIISDPPMLGITIPEELRNEHPRQFFRVPVHIRARFFCGTQDTLKTATEETKVTIYDRGLINNISGGGCRLVAGADICAGDIIVVNFSHTAVNGVGPAECEAVWVAPIDGGKKNVGLRYLNIDESARDKIIRYVFRRQMELREDS